MCSLIQISLIHTLKSINSKNAWKSFYATTFCPPVLRLAHDKKNSNKKWITQFYSTLVPIKSQHSIDQQKKRKLCNKIQTKKSHTLNNAMNTEQKKKQTLFFIGWHRGNLLLKQFELTVKAFNSILLISLNYKLCIVYRCIAKNARTMTYTMATPTSTLWKCCCNST